MTDFAAAPEPVIDRSIYGMPAFVSLAVADLVRSRRFYTEALDWIVLAAIPGPGGSDVLVHLRRWRYQDILLVGGAVEVGHGMSISVAADPDELDGLAAQVLAAGVGSCSGPDDSPWNTLTVTVTVTDPDGYRLTYTARRPEGRRDAAFEEMIGNLPTG